MSSFISDLHLGPLVNRNRYLLWFQRPKPITYKTILGYYCCTKRPRTLIGLGLWALASTLYFLFWTENHFYTALSQPLVKISKTEAHTMSSSFADSFDQLGGDSPAAPETHSFDEGYLGPDSFSNFDSTAADSPPPIYVSGGEFPSDPAYFSSETNDNGPILPPPAEMEPEEGYALREWRRLSLYRFCDILTNGIGVCALVVFSLPLFYCFWVCLFGVIEVEFEVFFWLVLLQLSIDWVLRFLSCYLGFWVG